MQPLEHHRDGFCIYMCQTGTVPRPATGKTPVRNLRVPEHIWRPALEKAQAEGRTLTEVITVYLQRYISTPPRSVSRAGSQANSKAVHGAPSGRGRHPVDGG